MQLSGAWDTLIRFAGGIGRVSGGAWGGVLDEEEHDDPPGVLPGFCAPGNVRGGDSTSSELIAPHKSAMKGLQASRTDAKLAALPVKVRRSFLEINLSFLSFMSSCRKS